MNNEPNEIGKWIQELTLRSVTEQMHALERYKAMVQRIANGEIDEQTVREEYMRFTREETAGYIRKLASLSLNYYKTLIELNSAYNDRFFDHVLGIAVGVEASSPKASPPQKLEIELRGFVGQDIASSFVIENKRTERAEISFHVSEFVGPTGTTPFRPPLQLKPPHFTLDPREELAVTLVLPLLPELFAPGQHYTARIIVRGYDDMELILNVWPVLSSASEEVSVQLATPESKLKAEAQQGKAPPKSRRSDRKVSRSNRKVKGEIAHDQ